MGGDKAVIATEMATDGKVIITKICYKKIYHWICIILNLIHIIVIPPKGGKGIGLYSNTSSISRCHWTVSVAQLCLTLWDSIHYSTPGSSVPHYLPEFALIHVHWVSDAIQASHPLSLLSPPTFHLSQHQGLFQWAGSLDQVAKVLEFHHQSF